jgi:hypothetical protein
LKISLKIPSKNNEFYAPETTSCRKVGRKEEGRTVSVGGEEENVDEKRNENYKNKTGKQS